MLDGAPHRTQCFQKEVADWIRDPANADTVAKDPSPSPRPHPKPDNEGKYPAGPSTSTGNGLSPAPSRPSSPMQEPPVEKQDPIQVLGVGKLRLEPGSLTLDEPGVER